MELRFQVIQTENEYGQNSHKDFKKCRQAHQKRGNDKEVNGVDIFI
jgi:hypothetical protein